MEKVVKILCFSEELPDFCAEESIDSALCAVCYETFPDDEEEYLERKACILECGHLAHVGCTENNQKEAECNYFCGEQTRRNNCRTGRSARYCGYIQREEKQ